MYETPSRGVMRLVLPQATEVKLTVMHDGKTQHIFHPRALPDKVGTTFRIRSAKKTKS